ncbi:MAG: AAA family ATPase [Candidatus Paceibacterota bacterium]|jgi:hypothetical protein
MTRKTSQPSQPASEDTGPGGVPITLLPKDQDFARATQIWKGAPKVGKTSTAAALGVVSAKYKLGFDPFFLLFEPGTAGVNMKGTSQKCPTCDGSGKTGKEKCNVCKGSGVTRLVLHTREQMHDWFTWAAKSKHNPIIIDTGDAMYQAVADSVCQELGIVSPFGANDHGVSWSMIYDEMRELLSILRTEDKGIIIIMHVYMQDVRLKGGEVAQKAVFNIAGKSRSFLAGMATQILHFDVVPDMDSKEKGKDKHVLIGAATSGIEAGDQWGLFPEMLDLGNSAEDGAEAILECFGYLERK